jgi:hypothetical protein
MRRLRRHHCDHNFDKLPIGTLVVDLYDTNTKRLVWRGTASDTLSDDPSKNEKKLEEAVSKMIAPDKFPQPVGKES